MAAIDMGGMEHLSIIHVGRSAIPSTTASGVQVMRMCEGYVEAGADVDLVVPRCSESILDPGQSIHDYYGVRPCFPVHRLAYRADSLAEAALHPALIAAKVRRYDLAHTRSSSFAWVTTVLARRPTVLELHGPLPERGRMRKRFDAALRSGRIVLIGVISEALRLMIEPELPSSHESRLMVLPDAVQSSALTDPRALRRGDGRQLTAVYTGSLYPGRGVEIIHRLACSHPRIRFVIVGGDWSSVDRWVSSGVPENLEFIGHVAPGEVRSWLEKADMLLMPYQRRVETSGGRDSAAYASPLKMFEYMASGKPIIGSDLSMLREVLTDGESALLVEPDDPAAWSQAVQLLANDRALGERLAKRALQDVASHTWTKRAERILDGVASISSGS